MTYTVEIRQIDEELFEIKVTIIDNEEVILEGVTTVVTNNEEEAKNYAENVFLVDLRRNDKRLVNLKLPCDTPEGGIE